MQTFRGREVRLPPRCAACEGFSLHGGTAVGFSDREGLERLCRYVARPPLASDRLDLLPDGRVRLTLKTPWHDGTTSLLFARADFVARLAALVPPLRAHPVLYHGVLAPRAHLRSRIVPTRPPPPPEASLRLTLVPAPVPTRWRTWAQLLARVFGQAGWRCPRCDAPMQLRAIVWPPAAFDVHRDLTRSDGASEPVQWAGVIRIFFGPLSGELTLADAVAKLVGDIPFREQFIVDSGGDIHGDGPPDVLVGAVQDEQAEGRWQEPHTSCPDRSSGPRPSPIPTPS